MGFADNLRAVRKERGISQEELAELLGVSRQAVSKWEQESGYPEMGSLIVLSRKLNVSLDYLVSGESDGASSGSSEGPVGSCVGAAEVRKNAAAQSPASHGASPTPVPHGTSSTPASQSPASSPSGRILIKSHDGKAVVNCYKVVSSPVFKTGKNEPKCALFGIDGSSFWGESSTLLGWYADEESIAREVDAIYEALQKGLPSYELHYAAKVKGGFLRVKLDG